MALQLKRGTNLQRLNLLLAEGEPFYVTNFSSIGVSPLWVGDGVTYGGNAVMPSELDELTDVAINYGNLTNTSVLQFDSSTALWKNQSNLNLNGTATFNNITTVQSNSISTAIPGQLAIVHSFDKTFRYSTLQKVPFSGDTNKNWLSVAHSLTLEFTTADIPDGTRFRFSALPADYINNNILSISTDYWLFGATNARFWIATSYANAIAQVGISSVLPLPGDGLGTAPIDSMIDPYSENIGISQEFKIQNRGLEAEYVAAKINAEKISDTDTSLKFFVRDDSSITATPQLTITPTGVIISNSGFSTSGSGSILNNFDVGGIINANSTTNSTSISTGSIVADGGVGIAKTVYIGENLNVAGTSNLSTVNLTGDFAITSTTQSTNVDTGALTVDGGVGINKILNVGGDVRIDSTTASSSDSTGALRVLGGVGIGGALYANSANITNNLTVTGNLTVNGTTTTINSTTLTVDDKNIELASTASPSDAAADGGGITLKGTTDKTIQWLDATDSWTFNQPLDSASGGKFGDVTVGKAANNQISTSTGNLILGSSSGTITTSAIIDSSNYIEAGNIRIGETYSAAPNAITSTTGEIVLNPNGTSAVRIVSGSNLIVESTLVAVSTVEFNGSVTTDMSFSNNGTSMRGVRGTIGTNDFWFVGGDATATNSGQLILATADDGTEPVLVRQYSGSITDANASYRELTLLDSSGNTTLPGSLVATGNVFVEGDGNIYVSGQSAVFNNNSVAGGDIELVAYRGTGGVDSTKIRWNETTDRWQFTNDGTNYTNFLLSTDSPTFQDLTINGDLTVTGNDIKGSGGTTALTLSAGSVTVADDLTVTGDNVNLAQATIIGYNENNDRLNRLTIRSTTGNTSGLRVAGPNTSSSSLGVISAFSSSDLANGNGLSLLCNNGTTNPYRIQMTKYTAGVVGTSGYSLQIVDNTTIIATINPSGPVDSTDLITKSYLEAGTSELAQVKLDSHAVLDTATLTTSATTADQVLDSNSSTTYRSAKYVIQITSGTDYQSVEAMVIHNGTTASITTYADIKTGSTDLATFAADISGGNVRLLTTPTNAVTTYKVVKTLITA